MSNNSISNDAAIPKVETNIGCDYLAKKVGRNHLAIDLNLITIPESNGTICPHADGVKSINAIQLHGNSPVSIVSEEKEITATLWTIC